MAQDSEREGGRTANPVLEGVEAGAAVQGAPAPPQPERFSEAAWVARSHELVYRLGEFRLCTWTFPALVLDRHHTDLPPALEAIELPLAKLPGEAEAIVIPSFASEASLPTMRLRGGHIRYAPERVSHHWIDLRGTYDAYLKHLRQKARHELRRKVNKLTEHLKGKLTFREFSRPDEMAEFHRLALQVSLKTYQERLLHAGLPASERFRQQIEELAGLDRVRGYLLLDGDAPMAYGYCEAQEPALIYVHTGYDPRYREWSPGIVLLARMLESAFAEARFRLLDLDWGDAQWKYYFATHTARGGRVIFFRLTPRHLVLTTAHWAVKTISSLTVRVLRAAGVKDALKRFFRSRATGEPSTEHSHDE